MSFFLAITPPKSFQPNSSYSPSCYVFSFHRSPSSCLLLSPPTRSEVHEGRMLSVLSLYIPDAWSTALVLAGAQHRFVQWMDKWLPVIQGDFSLSETSGAAIIHSIHLAAHAVWLVAFSCCKEYKLWSPTATGTHMTSLSHFLSVWPALSYLASLSQQLSLPTGCHEV